MRSEGVPLPIQHNHHNSAAFSCNYRMATTLSLTRDSLDDCNRSSPRRVIQTKPTRSEVMRKQIQSITMCLAIAAATLPMTAVAQENGTAGEHAVFVMTNAADQNEVIAYQRAAGGTLHEGNSYLTDGRGSGGNND